MSTQGSPGIMVFEARRQTGGLSPYRFHQRVPQPWIAMFINAALLAFAAYAVLAETQLGVAADLPQELLNSLKAEQILDLLAWFETLK